MTLDELAIKHNTDKGTTSTHASTHGYAPFYDEHLKKWREEPIRLLEIGVCMEGTPGGQSVRMWYEYFSKAEIYAFDIVDMKSLENDRVKFLQGDQSDRATLEAMYIEFGSKNFDFILEDGSHREDHQMVSFGHLFKYVKPGGYYILEDMSIPGQPACCIRNDKTYSVIKNFMETGKIDSEYITAEEKKYLEKNVAKIEIFTDIQNAYATALITKK
jgi:demethylmacrocin O-methyltransferase